ncbi:DLIC-domain-containing protein [Tilletiopsis washingtonensis]|uniref:DLIC-domain-containing protein n=1 Tax=Tilletiopsis washingtonensis TaxID=58919 RepID=A0A316Z7A1_9BASI|nr:DLIC-domain-containing protein [Tilletiopsis washingtonensis]PWN96954.1 DLIC-domain-containing protein [Tilletiopsis washingtonensis]
MLSERSALPHDAAAGSNGAGDALQPPATPAAPNGTAAPGEDDAQLWSSILASVHGSRAAPVRNVVMLGETGTGKSTLLAGLASGSTTSAGPSVAATMPSSSSSTNMNGHVNGVSATPEVRDLGLGYAYWDVRDDDGEDTLARVGVYQVPSSHPLHVSLLPLALQPPQLASSSAGPSAKADALRSTLWLLVLDWSNPSAFLDQLLTWLDIVGQTTREALGVPETQKEAKWGREQEFARELQEGLETYIRAYVEPVAPAATAGFGVQTPDGAATAPTLLPASAAGLVDVNLPLGDDVLQHNLGVSIVVVCTKADQISRLEKDRELKEEQFDQIQQMLRTICIKYGAALFYTAQSRPQTFDVLRSYVLHRLFTPAPASRIASSGTEAAAAPNGAPSEGPVAGGGTALSTRFPFLHRASTVERDILIVPSGWDSWGKIHALRDGYACAPVSAGWECDVLTERVRRERGLAKGAPELEDEARQQDRGQAAAAADAGVLSAVRLYEDLVAGWKAAPAPNPNSSRVKEPDEQAFLAQHFATLQKDPDTQSRLARLTSGGGGGGGGTPSVVGPMRSVSLSLPGVERAMQDRDTPDSEATVKPPRTSRRDSTRDSVSSKPTSPLLGSSPGASSPGGVKQSEVLHSFFQSLLNKEKTPSSSPSISRSARSGERRSHAPSSERGGAPSSGSRAPDS